MSEIKRPWTAGPWEATGGHIWVDTREQVCCGRGTSECCGQPDIRGGQELIAQASEADASLISVAPDMAEALIRLVERAEETIGCFPASAVASARSGGDFHFSISNEIVMAARSALRKAGMEGV